MQTKIIERGVQKNDLNARAESVTSIHGLICVTRCKRRAMWYMTATTSGQARCLMKGGSLLGVRSSHDHESQHFHPAIRGSAVRKRDSTPLVLRIGRQGLVSTLQNLGAGCSRKWVELRCPCKCGPQEVGAGCRDHEISSEMHKQ